MVLQKFRRQIHEGAVNFIFAHDGIEALHSIEEYPNVDMVVSDINMPRMDGLSLARSTVFPVSPVLGPTGRVSLSIRHCDRPGAHG